MISPTEAARIILENVVPFHREDCPLVSAHGRVLRVDLAADRDLPPYDRVTMDGYALRASALAAGVRTYRIGGTQAAGMRAFQLGDAADACIEVMTGAVLPEGADCVVPYEETRRDAGSMTVSEAASGLPAGNAVHRRGEDHRAGEVLVRAGMRLGGREIAVAAACGHASVTVTQVPRIAVVSTGDELVEIDMPVAAHQVRRSNDYSLRAALIQAGYPNVARFHLRDVAHEIEARLSQIVAEYDAVVVVGGVSKGKFDFVPSALEKQNVAKKIHGVAQRPGKPMWFGVSPRQTMIFGLPGNPVSCYTCLHRYVLLALARACGMEVSAESARRAVLSETLVFKPKLAYLLPVRLGSGGRGELLATPSATNTSGDFAGLLGTDGFLELPADQTEFPAGFVAPFWAW